MQTRVGAKVLIFNEDNKLLILRSSEWPDNPRRSLQPDLPGGIIEEDHETERDGALREVREETGIDLSERTLRLIYSRSHIYDDIAYTSLFYSVQLDATPEVLLSWEHDEYYWLSLKEVAARYAELRPSLAELFSYISRLDHV